VGTAAARTDDGLERLQRDLARGREGYGSEGGEGPQGQADRHGRGLAGAQPERARRTRLRQSHAQGREAGRVLELWKGIVNNEADAAIGSTISGQAKEAEASPRGLVYPPTPAADRAAWARVQRIAPYYAPHKATCGVGITAQAPVELPNYPYPIFVAYTSQSADVVYGITRSMIADYAAYKDGAPGAEGFELSRQNLSWVLPLHIGAVRAMKEVGAWKPEHETHQQTMVKRQAVLIGAWKEYLKSKPADDANQFRSGWMSARATALKQAGLDVIFE
jgi:hypothetical protein